MPVIRTEKRSSASRAYGEAAEDVEQLRPDALGVIEHEHRVGPDVVPVRSEVGVRLVEEIRRVQPHGQAQDAVEGPQEAHRGGGHLGQVDDAVAGLVEALREAPQRDGLPGAARSGDQREATHLAPELQAMEQIALGAGIEHLLGEHRLAKGDAGEGEVRLETSLLGFRKGAGVHRESLSWVWRRSRKTCTCRSRG